MTASAGDLPEGPCMLGSTIRGNFAMITVMFQAVIIQMCVLPMYQELEDRSPQKFDKIITTGFSALFVIFAGFSVFSYLLYGPGVESNILQNLPINIGSDVAQIGMMIVVACVYPIMLYPMVAIQPIASRGVGAQQVAKIIIVVLALLT